MKTKLSIIVSIILVTLVLLILVTYRRVFQMGGQVLFEFSTLLLILFVSIHLLIRWLREEFGKPADEIMKSMEEIRKGNLDYIVGSDGPSKVSTLCQEYEKLRMKLKADAEQKEQFVRESKEFISNISHDLKTPLTVIRGYSEGIIDGVVTSQEQKDKYIRTIYAKANEMEKLIEELIYYSQIDANRIPYDFKAVNVGELYFDCVEDIGADLNSAGIRFESTNEIPPYVSVTADVQQLKRVVHNIINNAVKYMDKPDGIIKIRFKDDNDFIKIEIEDNGKGIAEKYMPYIFNRFYRGDASRNSQTGGSGIGLSICRKIVEDHGGHIWARSKEGEGSTFTFNLRKHEVNANE